MSLKIKTITLLSAVFLYGSNAYAQFVHGGNVLEEAAMAIMSSKDTVMDAPPSLSYKIGDSGEHVNWLLKRLSDEGYLGGYVNDMSNEAVFDETVKEAVKSFQSDNNLNADGVVGPSTIKALTPITQTDLENAEVWAAYVAGVISDAEAAGHKKIIIVNIPTYTLHAIDIQTRTSAVSKVIVGTPGTRTPLIRTNIVNLKANPDWSPPPSIRGARYTRPGPNNPLGLMRFSTDNNMNIYLHDTNNRHLFDKDRRAMSHGCVRVKEWDGLAIWLSGKDEQWLQEDALGDGRTHHIKIDKTPVLISYVMADINNGKISVGQDIYNKSENILTN